MSVDQSHTPPISQLHKDPSASKHRKTNSNINGSIQVNNKLSQVSHYENNNMSSAMRGRNSQITHDIEEAKMTYDELKKML